MEKVTLFRPLRTSREKSDWWMGYVSKLELLRRCRRIVSACQLRDRRDVGRSPSMMLCRFTDVSRHRSDSTEFMAFS